jgi:hypothetical protein
MSGWRSGGRMEGNLAVKAVTRKRLFMLLNLPKV